MLAANCMEPDSLYYFNIFFSRGNCFPIVWSREVYWPRRRWGQYTSTDNTLAKLFLLEKTLICLVHIISFWT